MLARPDFHFSSSAWVSALDGLFIIGGGQEGSKIHVNRSALDEVMFVIVASNTAGTELLDNH